MKSSFVLIVGWLSLAGLSACAQDSGAPESAASPAATATEADGSSSEDSNANAEVAALTGDAEAGKRWYILCQSCHTVDAGGMNRVGPNLHGFLDRPAAQSDGFVYSAAFSEAGLTWTDEVLDQWITSPSRLVPGTTMIFAGIKDAQQRADLIAYLREVTAAD